MLRSKTLILALVSLFVLGALRLAIAQVPTIGYIPGYGYVITYVTHLLGPSLYIGKNGTKITNGLEVFAQSLTPAATSSSIGVSTQTFTVTGLTAGTAVFVSSPSASTQCPAVAARATAANTLAIDFANLAASACTPSAGTYSIFAIK